MLASGYSPVAHATLHRPSAMTSAKIVANSFFIFVPSNKKSAQPKPRTEKREAPIAATQSSRQRQSVRKQKPAFLQNCKNARLALVLYEIVSQDKCTTPFSGM